MGKKSPRQESNLYPTLRRRVHYPLCYEEEGDIVAADLHLRHATLSDVVGVSAGIVTLGALAWRTLPRRGRREALRKIRNRPRRSMACGHRPRRGRGGGLASRRAVQAMAAVRNWRSQPGASTAPSSALLVPQRCRRTRRRRLTRLGTKYSICAKRIRWIRTRCCVASCANSSTTGT